MEYAATESARATEPANKKYKKLSISFYGGKSLFSKKETPLHAREIYCCADACDLRDAGQCICMRNSLHWLDADYSCPFGKTDVHKGYTSRAQKYHAFKEKYESDPAFQVKLAKTDKYFFGRIDDCYVICYDWAGLAKKNGRWKVEYYKNPAVIPVDEFSLEMLYELIMFEGELLGKQIKERDKTHIPLFMRALEKGDADICGALLMLHPELADYKLDVIGKKAYLRTLVDGSVVTLDRKKWTKMGDKIICEDYAAEHGFKPFARGRVELEIVPDYTIEVAKEEWCDENTEFKG